jgi:hypothetical protein
MINLIGYLSELLSFGRLLYLDPGSGSVIFQLLIAGLVGAGFIIRLYWKKITGIFNRQEPGDEEPASDDDQ